MVTDRSGVSRQVDRAALGSSACRMDLPLPTQYAEKEEKEEAWKLLYQGEGETRVSSDGLCELLV